MRRRIAVTAVLAAGLALGLTGCTLFAPQATLIHYDASDGVSLNVGHLEVRNALVISPKGTDGALVGVFINTSNSPIDVEVQFTSHTGGTESTQSVDFTVQPSPKLLSLGEPNVPQEVLYGLNVKPGALARVFVRYGTVTGKYVDLPVLINSDGDYTGDAPSPTPTPTLTPTSIPTLAP